MGEFPSAEIHQWMSATFKNSLSRSRVPEWCTHLWEIGNPFLTIAMHCYHWYEQYSCLCSTWPHAA